MAKTVLLQLVVVQRVSDSIFERYKGCSQFAYESLKAAKQAQFEMVELTDPQAQAGGIPIVDLAGVSESVPDEVQRPAACLKLHPAEPEGDGDEPNDSTDD